MPKLEVLQKIKRLTISALVADDLLMGILVLKGGNALNLAYDISNRGSIDIDFSMEKDFTESEKKTLSEKIRVLLESEFTKENLYVFDITFSERPQFTTNEVKSFWGGYLLEFKVIESSKLKSFKGNFDTIRRNAIPLHSDNSTKFTVDISKYEYIGQKRPKDIEGAIVYVYSPEMLAIEKLRALCQQLPVYKEIVVSMTSKSRARDFYDIFNLTESFSIDYKTPENIDICRNIFMAKRVPLEFIKRIPEQREFHRQSWESVLSTVNQRVILNDFDFYFDFVMDKFKHIP